MAGLTSERSDGVGRSACSWAVVMLVNRWWLPHTFTWATQGLAVMGRVWDIQAEQDLNKTGRANCSSSRTEARQKTKAGIQSATGPTWRAFRIHIGVS